MKIVAATAVDQIIVNTLTLWIVNAISLLLPHFFVVVALRYCIRSVCTTTNPRLPLKRVWLGKYGTCGRPLCLIFIFRELILECCKCVERFFQVEKRHITVRQTIVMQNMKTAQFGEYVILMGNGRNIVMLMGKGSQFVSWIVRKHA